MDTTVEAIIKKIELSYAQIQQLYQDVPVTVLVEPALPRLPPERLADPVVQKAIARETWGHYAEHLPELERWHRQFITNRLPVLASELSIPQLFAREQF
jgi:hypothetical protein